MASPDLSRCVVLRRFRTVPEALAARSVLDSSGIEAFLPNEDSMLGSLGGVRLYVRPSDAEAAIAMLNEDNVDEWSSLLRLGKRALETDTTSVLIVKYWMPFLALFGTYGVFWNSSFVPADLFVVLPLICWALFNLTSAQVRVGKHYLEYRRFLTWRKIRFDDIRECKRAWVPAMGRLTLRRDGQHWRVVYFLLPQSGARFTTFVNHQRDRYKQLKKA